MASSTGGSDLGLFGTCWDVVPIPGNDDFHWSGALRYGYQLVQTLGPAEKEGWSRADTGSSQAAIVNFDDRPAGAEVYPSQMIGLQALKCVACRRSASLAVGVPGAVWFQSS